MVLDLELDHFNLGACELLRSEGVDVEDVAYKLSCVIPSVRHTITTTIAGADVAASWTSGGGERNAAGNTNDAIRSTSSGEAPQR